MVVMKPCRVPMDAYPRHYGIHLRGLDSIILDMKLPGPGASLQLHHEHLCKYVNDIPVGEVLKSVEPGNCEAFYNLYLHDFVTGMHRCKHKSPDLKSMEVKVSTKQN